ncbi:MAG: hypothetical protein JO006_20640 [Paucibacter sp.]|nr:hypothetical protein [Roseateles sp.]
MTGTVLVLGMALAPAGVALAGVVLAGVVLAVNGRPPSYPTIAAGETRVVKLALDARAFRHCNTQMKEEVEEEMQEVVEPGLYDIMVGPNSRDLQSTVLEITT